MRPERPTSSRTVGHRRILPDSSPRRPLCIKKGRSRSTVSLAWVGGHTAAHYSARRSGPGREEPFLRGGVTHAKQPMNSALHPTSRHIMLSQVLFVHLDSGGATRRPATGTCSFWLCEGAAEQSMTEPCGSSRALPRSRSPQPGSAGVHTCPPAVARRETEYELRSWPTSGTGGWIVLCCAVAARRSDLLMVI